MKKLKRLYFIHTDEYGEGDGVFNEKEHLLDFWFGNDANWRNEYFYGFMEQIGFECLELHKGPVYKRLLKKLHTAMKEASGCEDEA